MSGAPATPHEFRAALTVCVDFANPHAYLAVEPTRALERRLAVALDWLPFAAPPLHRPPPPRPDDDRGTRHRRIRALYFERDLARYAAARDLDLGNVYRDVDTVRARIGLLWIRRVAPAWAGAYVARLFDLLWAEGVDVAAPEVVTGVVAALAPDRPGFLAYAEREGEGQLEAAQNGLVAAGVFGVPAYVLAGGEIFIGRQHLPLLEARLRQP